MGGVSVPVGMSGLTGGGGTTRGVSSVGTASLELSVEEASPTGGVIGKTVGDPVELIIVGVTVGAGGLTTGTGGRTVAGTADETMLATIIANAGSAPSVIGDTV